ncbi:MAG: IS1595 family transposase [Owenweeksia sp.]|nr:IS1595 family transposase [Owenweeksia sp.]
MEETKDIKALFERLPAQAQEQLLNELLQEQELKGQVLENAREELKTAVKRKPCPHCHSEKAYKRGKQNNVQMYQCRDCKKWYSETTGTPLWDIKLKHKWQAYLRCMQQGMPIKKIAKELGISIQTSFDWRHKILSALSQLGPDQLQGTVECDELEIPINQKGARELDRKPRKRSSDFKRDQYYDEVTTVQVVTAVERGGGKYLKAVESKRLSKEQVEKALKGKLSKDVTLITDKHTCYKALAKENKTLKHKTVRSTDHVNPKDKTVHLQHVNNTHKQLRDFLRPFNGVSSKYLQNYLKLVCLRKRPGQIQNLA